MRVIDAASIACGPDAVVVDKLECNASDIIEL
jgi:hypothetical protein